MDRVLYLFKGAIGLRLNVEQRKIIELEPNGHMLVKGVAGSGKTMVAVHRASFLQEHYCPEKDDRLLIVTYNKTLLKYLKYQYEEIKISNDPLSTLFKSGAKLEINNIDSLMFRYFRVNNERGKLEIASPGKVKDAMQKAIAKVHKEFPDIELLTDRHLKFFLDEIEWIKACDIPDMETYQEIDRIGRSEGGSGNPHKLLKNSRVREAIYTLMEVYDELLLKDQLVDFKTMNQIALEEAMKGNHPKYTHILIDESQDLSKVQLKFIKQLHADKPYASVMFVADNTQSIYPQSWLGKGRAYATIGFDMSGKSRTLSKNYRTTTEISKAAYALIEDDENINGNADYIKPALIDRHGHKPIYNIFEKNIQQTEFILNEIETLKEQYALRDICIVSRTKQPLESIQVELNEAKVPCELMDNTDAKFDTDKVKMTTMHSIKGLEFKVVFLINLDEKVIPNERALEDDELISEERKLLYVGMTRAKELLYLSSVGKASSFIEDIDKSLLSMKNGVQLRPFHRTSISNYKFTDQIDELHSKEEVVRQWMLRELEERYGYPEQLMTIEYPVQQFSKRGYVDIAITVEQDGKTLPYIFVEVKKYASGIDEALDQLKSYMQTSQDVKYGIVTDGVELKILNQHRKEITDFPSCEPYFLPHTKHQRTYHNLRNNTEYGYSQQIDDLENIEVIDLKMGLHVAVEENVQVPLVGSIAAGIPQTANEHFEELIALPKDWLIQGNQSFALRVTGDSMSGVGIEKGDIVIVHRQESIDNNDIAIVVIGEEATMKKYMQMGSSVLLISENPSYEPIQMDAKDVQINGKVIGVLKERA